MKNVAILGSTGSIGLQALEVIKDLTPSIKVLGLAAGENINLLTKQILEFKPACVSVNNAALAKELKQRIKNLKTEIVYGEEGLSTIASLSEVDLVLVALSGIAGLMPTFSALKNKKNIALATKEVLVTAGEIIIEEAKKNNLQIIPVDSEHSAIFQILNHQVSTQNIKRLILTASGGPFLKIKNLTKVTIKQALKHPNWKMGKKITIDSATLMNKGLEVIEAHHLFDIDYDKIEVIIHPQSIIHSMVEAIDNSIFAQMSLPDMRIPIQYALTYPQRLPRNSFNADFAKLGQFTFETPDLKRFPCLRLAYEAGRAKGLSPCVLNAANEAAVELFLQGKIKFLDIPRLIEDALNNHHHKSSASWKEILACNKWTREFVWSKIKI